MHDLSSEGCQAVVYCVHCRAEALNNSDVKFCTKCGFKLVDLGNQESNCRQNEPIPATPTSTRENCGECDTADTSVPSHVCRQRNERTMSYKSISPEKKSTGSPTIAQWPGKERNKKTLRRLTQ